MDELVCIFRTSNPIEAHLIKSIFDNEDIFCFIKSNDASGTMPHLRFFSSIELMVHRDDLPFAEKILQQREENLFQSES